MLGEMSEVRSGGEEWEITDEGCRHNWYHCHACISITIILSTCGTHLGDTKLVASIDERPVSDSISINLILVSVGTIAYKQNRTMQLWTITTAWCLALQGTEYGSTEYLICKLIFAEPGRLSLSIVISEYFLYVNKCNKHKPKTIHTKFNYQSKSMATVEFN